MNSKTEGVQEENSFDRAVAITSLDGEDAAFAGLGASLAEIRKLKGVAGYIMRGISSAILDLDEDDKASQFAFLSYQLNESCLEIAKLLSVAEVESCILEGKALKVLFMKIGENKICVFMETDTNHVGIIKRILI